MSNYIDIFNSLNDPFFFSMVNFNISINCTKKNYRRYLQEVYNSTFSQNNKKAHEFTFYNFDKSIKVYEIPYSDMFKSLNIDLNNQIEKQNRFFENYYNFRIDGL